MLRWASLRGRGMRPAPCFNLFGHRYMFGGHASHFVAWFSDGCPYMWIWVEIVLEYVCHFVCIRCASGVDYIFILSVRLNMIGVGFWAAEGSYFSGWTKLCWLVVWVSSMVRVRSAQAWSLHCAVHNNFVMTWVIVLLSNLHVMCSSASEQDEREQNFWRVNLGSGWFSSGWCCRWFIVFRTGIHSLEFVLQLL